MSVRIQDLPRFQQDIVDYKKRIEAIPHASVKQQAEVMFETFINAVQAVDQSVENLAEAGPVFGNEHQVLRENLARVRLDLVRWLKKHSPVEKTKPIPMNG